MIGFRSAVAAESPGELLQRRDAARLGTRAPVLELADQLLRGGVRALPHRGQLLAHGVDRREYLALADRVVHLGALVGVHRRGIDVQHALHRSAVDADGALLEVTNFLGAGLAQRLAVLGEHVVAVRDDGLHRGKVAAGLRAIDLQLWRNLFYLGEAESPHGADVRPADIELVPAAGEFRRTGVGVVIIVKLLAADQDAPG